MRLARLPLLAAGLLVALLVAPSAALAADPVTVSGSVVRDGAPVAGIEVTISVAGSYTNFFATTDDDGAFSADIEATAGDVITFMSSGDTTQATPDANGCVAFEMPWGRVVVTLDEQPPAPIRIDMDQVVKGAVCGETASPVVTPPATDAPPVAHRDAAAAGSGLLLEIGVLALAGALSLSVIRRRA